MEYIAMLPPRRLDVDMPGIPSNLNEAITVEQTKNPSTSPASKWTETEYEICYTVAAETNYERFAAVFDDIPLSASFRVTPAIIGSAWNPHVLSGKWDILKVVNDSVLRNQLVETVPISEELLSNIVYRLDYGSMLLKLAYREHWLPEDLLELMAREKSPNVGLALIDRKDLPLHVLMMLAENKSSQVRVKLAQRETLPTEIIEKLGNDDYYRVLTELAKRPTPVDPKVLLHIIETSPPFVRQEIASQKEALPDSVISALSYDPEPSVRAALIENPSIDMSHKIIAGLYLETTL